MFRHLAATVAAAVAFMVVPSEGYYIPHFKEQQLRRGEGTPVWVNSLTSQKALVPIGFYSLGMFPAPEEIVREKSSTMNMGMLFSGDRLESSVYEVAMMKNEKCVDAGTVTVRKNTLIAIENAIKSQYRVNMAISGMQAVHQTPPNTLDCYGHHQHARGFPLGCSDGDDHYINTHVTFIVGYNKHKVTQQERLSRGDKKVPPAFFVTDLKVIASDGSKECGSKVIKTNRYPSVQKELKFTYSVQWALDNSTAWANRWDRYIDELVNDSADTDTDTERQSLLTCVVVVACLTVLVAMIVMRTLHLDFNRYNNPDNDEEFQEEVGWKLVHGDVFRPPPRPNMFAVIVGSGAQLLGMALTIAGTAVLGIFYPGARGRVMGYMIVSFCLMAILNGFVTGRIQMAFGQRNWKTVIIAALAFPSFVFVLWVITEIALSSAGAANSVGISTVLQLLLVWWGVSLPLVVAGAAISYKKEPVVHPLSYRNKEREIKEYSWLFSTPAQLLLPSVIIFTMALLEVKLLFGALWQGRVLHLFGYLAVTAILVIVVTAEVTIVCIYYQLVYEDWRWWWSSLIIPSGVGVYTLLFSINYQMAVLELSSGLAIWIFYSCTLTFSIAFALMCATVGFYSCWFFTCKIYSAIKID